MSARIHEYPLETPARLAYAVRWLGAGIAVGGGASFLLGLGASITLNEAFIDIWYDVDLDPVSRSFIPLLFVAVAVGLFVFGVSDSIYKWLIGRQLARAATVTPSLVPPHWQREILSGPAPLAGAATVIWTVFGLAALVALGFFAILGETSNEDVAFVSTVAIGAVVLAVVLVATNVLVLGRARRRWRDVVAAAAATWSRHTVRESEGADRARRPRGEKDGPSGLVRVLNAVGVRLFTVGAGAVVLGSAVGLAGVFLRQPCRGCDQRSYESFGETLIDSLAVIGFAVTALGLVVLVVTGLVWTAAGILTDRMLWEGASGIDAQRRPEGVLLQDRLVSVSLAESYSILLSGLGAVVVTAALSAAALALPLPAGLVDALMVAGIALLAVALVLAYVGVGYNLRLRSALRERWAPADIAVAKAGRVKRRHQG